MKKFINKKANVIEEAIINAIVEEIGKMNVNFSIDIEVNDTTIILDGTCEIEESYDESDNSASIESVSVMIDNFNAYDMDGEDKVVDVDTLKIEEEVEKLIA